MKPETQLLLAGPWPARFTSAIILMLFAWWAYANVLPLFAEKTQTVTAKQTAIEYKSQQNLPIKNLDLFGTPEKRTAVNKASDAIQTKLNFILRGVLATDDPKQGIAQIQNESKQEKHFAVNDSVFGIATLEEIHVDRVILFHNGRYETLLLPEEFLNVKHFSAEQHKRERKKIASDYRKLFLSRDGETLRKLFGFDTAWKNGGFAGFIVKALSDEGRDMMAKFGVEDGDLITVVNGLRFSESLQAAQQLTGLKTATSVDIIIEREGQEFPLHIEFDDPMQDIADVSGNASPQPGAATRGAQNTPQEVDSDAPGVASSPLTSNSSSDDTNSSAQSSGGAASTSTGYAATITTSNPETSTKGSEPKPTFEEKEGAEEYKRLQRERTTGPSLPVGYDH